VNNKDIMNLINLVGNLLDENKLLESVKSDNEKEQIKRKISFLEKNVNQLVYSLYNITEDEINVIEAS
jgi:hypothetical protein